MNPSVEPSSSPDCKGRPLGSNLDHVSATVSKTSQVESQQCELSDEAFLSTEKSLVRKLDSTLMPAVFILYLFNYLDRNNIAYVEAHGCYIYTLLMNTIMD